MVLRPVPCRCTLPPDPEARYTRPDPEWVCPECENTLRVWVPTTYRPRARRHLVNLAAVPWDLVKVGAIVGFILVLCFLQNR